MTPTLRTVLILASLATCWYAIRKIRASRVDIADTVYWILVAAYLLLISVFPGVAEGLSRLLGVETTVNTVFLSVCAILLYKCFTLTVKVSALEIKLKTLADSLAVKSTILAEQNAARDAQKESEPRE